MGDGGVNPSKVGHRPPTGSSKTGPGRLRSLDQRGFGEDVRVGVRDLVPSMTRIPAPLVMAGSDVLDTAVLELLGGRLPLLDEDLRVVGPRFKRRGENRCEDVVVEHGRRIIGPVSPGSQAIPR